MGSKRTAHWIPRSSTDPNEKLYGKVWECSRCHGIVISGMKWIPDPCCRRCGAQMIKNPAVVHYDGA